ncbi:MAG: hypothetical protein U5S82_13165 [Gammaproteobacteria bacterium]|nr:hypothetical protein [Gammaproteobacteria bacterium]
MSQRQLLWLVAGACGAFLVLRFAAVHEGVPYNVRELFALGPTLSSLLLVAGLYLLFSPLALVTPWIGSGGAGRGAALVGLVIGHAALAYALLRMVVPLEAIHDVVGYPVWGQVPEVERLIRFIALFSSIFLLLLLGTLLAAGLAQRAETVASALRRWAGGPLVYLVLAYLLVVPYAATVNLVELIEQSNRALGAFFIASSIVMAGLAAGLLAALLSGANRRPWFILPIILATAPLAYGGLWLGTENDIIKYGQRFSALQFLLSANRDALVHGMDLWLRYGIAYLTAIGLLSIILSPFWPAGPTTLSDKVPSLPKRRTG